MPAVAFSKRVTPFQRRERCHELAILVLTSRQQAIVTRIDGRWYIEDKSEQKTTFVQAAKRIELHDGDIILLGNRLFEFHE